MLVMGIAINQTLTLRLGIPLCRWDPYFQIYCYRNHENYLFYFISDNIIYLSFTFSIFDQIYQISLHFQNNEILEGIRGFAIFSLC